MSCSTVLQVVDSHTEGEPTRVVVEGVPALATGTVPQQRDHLAAHADWIRTALTREPRGAEWMVGAALLPPSQPGRTAGVVFFNNAGYLGMCGHGLMGVVRTLQYRQAIRVGRHRFETPVGEVTAELHEDGSISFENVTSFRFRQNITVPVPDVGDVVGDIAYGGNWFFLVAIETLERLDLDGWTSHARRVMDALHVQDIRGADGAVIDHVEFVGPPTDPKSAHARNFVLCPGGHYDRSPCGTGTSAKLACLAADGKLAPGQEWRQESIIGSLFRGSYQPVDDGVIPTIRGHAYVTAELSVIVDDADPFRYGFN